MFNSVDFNHLSLPAKLYFGLAVLGSLLSWMHGYGIVYAVMDLVYGFVWTMIITYIYRYGYHTVAWGIVAAPYLLFALSLLRLRFPMVHSWMRTLKIQGWMGNLEGMTSSDKDKDTPKKTTSVLGMM